MASDPEIRAAVLRELELYDGCVSGDSYGDVADTLRPDGASVRQTKQAINSLAYSSNRPPAVRISRTPLGRASRGAVTVQFRV